MNNMINFNPMFFNNQIKYDFAIMFEKNGLNRELNREISLIQCNSKDKLSDVIKKYELKTGAKGKNKYIYNGYTFNMNDDITVQNSWIPYSGKVQVVGLDELVGGSII